MFKKLIYLTLCCSVLWACQNESEGNQDFDAQEEIIAKIPVKTDILRLDEQLFACQSREQILDFLQKDASITSVYFQTSPKDFGTLATRLESFMKEPSLRQFQKQSQDTAFFGNLEKLKTDFKTAFQHIKHHYPTFKEPKICTIFSGFAGPDLLVNDSLIVVGLDYFMGSKAKYRPQLYDYQLKRYAPEYIVPQSVMLLSEKYNLNDPQDKTLLAEMVFYGKALFFAENMMPLKSDSLFLGYSEAKLNEVEFAQDLIWAHFIEEKVLFKTDDSSKQKYIIERPSTPEIGPKCPGMIGRWIGRKIVYKYWEKDDKTTIQDVMKQANAQQLFEQSAYKGVADEQ